MTQQMPMTHNVLEAALQTLRMLAAMDEAASAGQFAYLCPGCRQWQIEFSGQPPRDESPEIGISVPYIALLDALDGHRADCATFNMLMGLTG